jgi:purine-nucleoside phosphorylase
MWTGSPGARPDFRQYRFSGKAYSNESFSEFLDKHSISRAAYPDKGLFAELLRYMSPRKVICSSIPTMKLESRMLYVPARFKISVTDMECSAFFKAAACAGIKAAALFYVTDVVHDYPCYKDPPPAMRKKLVSSISRTARGLSDFIRERLWT